jgi:hypothetical protein
MLLIVKLGDRPMLTEEQEKEIIDDLTKRLKAARQERELIALVDRSLRVKPTKFDHIVEAIGEALCAHRVLGLNHLHAIRVDLLLDLSNGKVKILAEKTQVSDSQ